MVGKTLSSRTLKIKRLLKIATPSDREGISKGSLSIESILTSDMVWRRFTEDCFLVQHAEALYQRMSIESFIDYRINRSQSNDMNAIE